MDRRAPRFLKLNVAKVVCLGVVLGWAGAALAGREAFAQGPTAPSSAAPSDTLASMTHLRDSFIQRVIAAGFTCPIAPPKIVVEDVPSFGQYQPEFNTLRTADWALLNPRGKAYFRQLAGPGTDEAQAHSLFETAAHQWIFVHELGHWWQACTGGNAKRSHYQIELGANRVSLSFWREVDPKVVEIMMPVFQSVLDHATSPVPEGQSVEDFFNAHYETLGPSPAYPWFMSRMNVAAFEETPAPAFAAVLAATRQ